MPQKQSTKQRTKVKALPKKSKKLSGGDMKKLQGGGSLTFLNATRQKTLVSDGEGR